MNRFLIALGGAAALSAALASPANAQCNAQTDLSITVTPAVAPPGQPVTVTLTNNSTSCTYTLPSGCLYGSVHDGDCNGNTVTGFFCTLALKPVGPGQSISQTWDQLDDLGNPVGAGTYAFNIRIWDPGFTQIEEFCPTVQVGNICPNPPSNYGPASPGTGGIAPDLGTIGGLPTIGNVSFALTVSNGRGGSVAMLFIGANAANLAAPFGTFLVDPNPPLLQIPFSLGGAPGAPGAGSALIPAPLPNDPNLIGVDVYMQVLIADPQSSDGISHTPGLTFGICQ